ncbi:protease inhibitor Inh/omp19 family protein [Rhizobium sp. NRK18]|jgi:hypothetical protein|uniref:protease inhibitor Inh/omp19 family protein n=1 Tax=Rhizobium sp. NRK18 TaxID=2964667 RepID=UPI0021C30618|nr:protease inhibitor Inh/omp19 family protein [Rhizobium sp. NRK18]MCQ2002988.1 protease inhibitor Inh/omp19 family protein [Rhizobium sp. NRK18]
MQFRFAAAGVMIALALSGCQRTSYYDQQPSSTLPPLQAQPVPSVQSGQLPPPNGTQMPGDQTMQNGMPPAGNPAVAANAMDVTKESMVGSWKVSNSGVTCDMFLTLTNLGSGLRGGTRGCLGPLTTMASWEVSGKQISVKDRDGNVIGTLYKTADARFDGTTAAGQPFSLSR